MKTMKKICQSLLFGLLCLTMLFGPLTAVAAEGTAVETVSAGDTLNTLSPEALAALTASRLMFTDEEGLLTTEEAAVLNALLLDIRGRQQTDIAVAVRSSLNGQTPDAAGEAAYGEMGLGYGEDRSGILLMLFMSDREWTVYTYGKGTDALPRAAARRLMGDIQGQLSDGAYAAAFRRFAEGCDAALTTASQPKSLPIWVYPAAVGIGFLIAFLIMSGLKGQLKSVRSRAGASEYVRGDSLDMQVRQETFLRTDVTRTAKPQQSSGGSSDRSSSGGQSTSGRF